MSASMLMATSSSEGTSNTITCPTCDFTTTVSTGSRRTICPKCGGFYSREAAERPEPRRLARNRKKDSTGRRGFLNFFSNLTPGNNANKEPSGFSVLSSSDSSSDKSSNKSPELPPIDSRGRLTAGSTNSRSTTPLYAQEHVQGTSSVKSHKNAKSPKPPKGGHMSVTINGNDISALNHGVTSPGYHDRVIYPVRTKNSSQLRALVLQDECFEKNYSFFLDFTDDVRLARETGQWKGVQDFYYTTFSSFLEINAAFKRDPNKDYKSTDDPGLKFEFINTVYDLILGLPQDIQKVVLKSMINSLLKDKKNHDSRMNWPHSKDDLRAYLVLLQNPQFGNATTYVIFAHLLRQISALSDHDHHYLVYWIRKISSDRFQTILERLNCFISIRLFPPKPQDLPSMSKCSWWIPSATKVMALLNAANSLNLPTLVSFVDFYNATLDNLDLMQEYAAWQDPTSAGGFSFCQYPFILSISAKRSILQRDSEQQMIIMARRSLVAKVQRRQLPDVGMLFLNLTVRREHLVSDSLNEISKKQHDLKKKLKVTFTGEPGLDMGGLTKEWFLLLIKQIFQENYGMFTYDKMAGVYWFGTTPREDYQEFNLVGVLMGLAVYNSIILDLRFPPCCYKKLLSPPVVPYNNPRATVGITRLALNDLKLVHPDVAKGLQDLLDYDGNVEDDFCLTFQISSDQCGVVKTVELKSGGANIPVTNENKKEYVDLYVDWMLNKSIYSQFKAFYHGFHTVCASNALIMLRPEEIDMLVCGNPKLDMKELKKVTIYDGFNPNDPIIRAFWETVLSMPISLQKQFLMFTTGSDRVPIGGMGEMTFKITRTDDTDLLPMSHTCFNQLILPVYKSKKLLRHKLVLAIQNTEGFGLE